MHLEKTAGRRLDYMTGAHAIHPPSHPQRAAHFLLLMRS